MLQPDEVYTAIISEVDELTNSVNKLTEFVQSDDFNQLTEKEQSSLKAQLVVIKKSLDAMQ